VTTTQPDASIAVAFGSRFAIPLDFEILTDHGPFYQAGLNNRLSFELTFNDYGHVIKSPDATATYQITNIALEFDVVTNPDLGRLKRQQYTKQTVLLYTRILRHRKLVLDKSDVTWNINLNTPHGRSKESCCSSRTQRLAPWGRSLDATPSSITTR